MEDAGEAREWFLTKHFCSREKDGKQEAVEMWFYYATRDAEPFVSEDLDEVVEYMMATRN